MKTIKISFSFSEQGACTKTPILSARVIWMENGSYRTNKNNYVYTRERNLQQEEFPKIRSERYPHISDQYFMVWGTSKPDRLGTFRASFISFEKLNSYFSKLLSNLLYWDNEMARILSLQGNEDKKSLLFITGRDPVERIEFDSNVQKKLIEYFKVGK